MVLLHASIISLKHVLNNQVSMVLLHASIISTGARQPGEYDTTCTWLQVYVLNNQLAGYVDVIYILWYYYSHSIHVNFKNKQACMCVYRVWGGSWKEGNYFTYRANCNITVRYLQCTPHTHWKKSVMRPSWYRERRLLRYFS